MKKFLLISLVSFLPIVLLAQATTFNDVYKDSGEFEIPGVVKIKFHVTETLSEVINTNNDGTTDIRYTFNTIFQNTINQSASKGVLTSVDHSNYTGNITINEDGTFTDTWREVTHFKSPSGYMFHVVRNLGVECSGLSGCFVFLVDVKVVWVKE